MRMLEPGDHLSFAFESTNEFWLVGVFWRDDLYCHIARDHALVGAIDNAKAALSQQIAKFVAFNCLTR